MALRLHARLTAGDEGFGAAMAAATAMLANLDRAGKSAGAGAKEMVDEANRLAIALGEVANANLGVATATDKAEAANDRAVQTGREQINITVTATAEANNHARAIGQVATELVRQADAAAQAAEAQRRINELLGVRAPDAETYRRRAEDIAAWGQQIDGLRAKYVPFEVVLITYRNRIDEINEAERVGILTAKEAVAARTAQTRAMQELAAAEGARAQAAFNQVLGVTAPDADAYRQRAEDIAAWGQQVDALRARYVPLEAQLIQHRQALEDIEQAERNGILTAREAAQARDAAGAALRRGQDDHYGRRAEEIAAWGREVDTLRARYVPLEAELIAHRRAIEEIEQAERNGALTAKEAVGAREQATTVLRRAQTAHEQATAAANGNTRALKLTAHEATNLSYQLQDVFVQLAGGQSPFLILAQQGPQAASAVGGVGRLISLIPAGMLVATAATAGLAVVLGTAYSAWSDYRESVLAVDRANRLAVISTGLTRVALDAQARAGADAAEISLRSARSLQAAYVGTGRIGNEVMSGLIGITRDFAVATSQDMEEAGQYLARAFADPARGAVELTQRMGLLDDKALANVKSLAGFGRAAEAQVALLEALTQRVKGAHEELSVLDRVAKGVGNWFSNGWDNFGKSLDRLVDGPSPAEKAAEDLAKLQTRATGLRDTLQRLYARGRTAENNGDVAGYERQLREVEAKLREHEAEKARIEQEGADKRAAQQAADFGRQAGELAKQLDSFAARRKELETQKSTLETGLTKGMGLDDPAQVEQQLERVKGALGSLMTEQEKAQRLAQAEAAAVAMTGVARDKYLAKVRAEVETSGQLLTAKERQARVDQAVASVTNQHSQALADLTRQQQLAAEAQDRLAAASGKGEAAQRAAIAANEIAAASARSAAEGALARDAATRREAAAVLGIKGELIEQLAQETVANDRMTAALRQGSEAVAAAAREEFRLAAQRRLGVDAVEDLTRVMEAYDRLVKSQADRAEAGDEGRRLADMRAEVELLERRNKLLAEQARGGTAGLRAGADVMRLDVQAQIDSQVLAKQRELEALQRNNIKVNIEGETKRLRLALENQAALEEQLETQRLALDAADSLGRTFNALEAGDIHGVTEGISSFVGEFRDLQAQTGSAESAFAALGEQLLNSAEAGSALGDLVGKLFGRSEQQNKNAKIGATVATTVGDFFGVPKGISSFVGNIIGGLFGPGKSDATAGVEIYPTTRRVNNFDTSPSRQDSGNMSARDALADSVRQFTDLLKELTGGQLANAIAIEVGSRDGNRWRVYGTDGQLASSGTTAVGDIEGTLSAVLAAVTQTLTGVSDELKARLTSIDFSDLERAQDDVAFVLAYETAIQSLNGQLEGGREAVETARQNVVDLRNYVKDFTAQAGRLGFNVGETAEALRAHVERFAGITQAARPMTEVEVKVAALIASFEELGPVLESVGYSADAASRAVNTARENQMGQLRADWVGQMDRQFNETIGNGFINQIRDLFTDRNTQYHDADALGVDRSIVDRNVGVALGGIITSDLRPDQLNEIIRLFGTEFPEAAAAARTALANVSTGLDNTAAAAQRASQTREVVDSLADRTARADGSGDTLTGQLAMFDRAANAEKAAMQARINAGELGAEALTKLEQTLAAERLSIVKAAEAKAAAITRSLDDRKFALSVADTRGGNILLLERQQNAEYAVAQAAGYSAAQLATLAEVLAGEMTAAVKAVNDATREAAEQALAAARAINDRFGDRLFAATTDTSTLAGALAAFDRAAGKQRAEAAKTAGADMAALEQALGAERTAIIKRFTDEAARAEQERLDRVAALNKGWADRLFAATNDNSTLAGALAAFDRQAADQRIEAAQTAGADLLALEATLAAERAKIIKQFSDQAIAAEKQRQEALTQAGGQLREWIDSVRAGNGTSEQNLATVRSQFAQQLELAQGGNVDAVQGIREYAQRLIDAETARTASGDDRRTMVNAILAQLEALPAVKSWDQQILEELQGLRDGVVVDVSLGVIRTITEQLDLLPDAERDQLVQAQTIIREIEERLGRPLTAAELDALIEGDDVIRTVQQWLGRDLTPAERAAILTADRVERQVEQVLGRQLTPAEAATLIQAGGVPRTVTQTVAPPTGAQVVQPGGVPITVTQTVLPTTGAALVLPEAVTRTINQVLTIQGQVLTSQGLSQQIAIELGNVQFQGQALANRYLAAIAWNTSRMIGAAGGGLLVADDPAVAGDQTQFDGRAAANLSVKGGEFDAHLAWLPSIHGAITDLKSAWDASLRTGGFVDKIRHNTAESARMLGGYPSYDVGTDSHPGGWAYVHRDELINLPSGADVYTKSERMELARAPRRAMSVPAASNAAELRALAEAMDRQARATERQNALLERIAAAAANGADAAAETVAVLKKPARVKVGAIAKLRGAA